MPSTLLSRWLQRQLEPASRTWFDARREALATAYTDRDLHITLGLIPRRLGKADLALSQADRDAANEARSGLDPRGWSVADAARVLVLLDTTHSGAHSGNQPFTMRFADLCRNADVGELIAYYRGLPLYPEPDTLADQAAEGLRSNMRAVFEAVAHGNPYPGEVFDQRRWNQMVLKALFVGSTLAPILALDQRANPELASILCDYAHERWAAGRTVTPELWRCVGPFAEGAMLDDLARVLRDGGDLERRAAFLALNANPLPAARTLLQSAPDLCRMHTQRAFGWEDLDPAPGAAPH